MASMLPASQELAAAASSRCRRRANAHAKTPALHEWLCRTETCAQRDHGKSTPRVCLPQYSGCTRIARCTTAAGPVGRVLRHTVPPPRAQPTGRCSTLPFDTMQCRPYATSTPGKQRRIAVQEHARALMRESRGACSAPEPVPRSSHGALSSARADVPPARTELATMSTMASVSGRGMRTPGPTASTMSRQCAAPHTYCSGSRACSASAHIAECAAVGPSAHAVTRRGFALSQALSMNVRRTGTQPSVCRHQSPDSRARV